VLIVAKNEGYIVRLNVDDPRDQMETNISKWQKIIDVINVSGHSPLARNGVACKVIGVQSMEASSTYSITC
jgi:hypothetical protein